MRIEIIVGSDDPIIFPLRSSKITVGASESCDIVLPYEGISRRHISILTEGDSFFIVDQGSTNGTYMNEERLIPGRRVEFTSFFPVRLGDNTLVSLISDNDNDFTSLTNTSSFEGTSPSIPKPVLSNPDATRTISLKDLQKANTQKLVKQRDRKRVEVNARKAPVKRSNSFSKRMIPFLAFCIVGVAAYYNFYVMDLEPVVPKVEQIGKIVPVEPEVLPVNTKLIDESDLVQKDSYIDFMNNPKCLTDIEKYLCQLIVDVGDGRFGVLQVGTTIHVLMDGKKYYEIAQSFKELDEKKEKEDLLQTKILQESVAYLILLNAFPEKLDMNILKDNKMSVAVFKKENDQFVLDFVIAIKPTAYNELRPLLRDDFQKFIKDAGLNTFKLPREFYRIY